MDPPLRETMLVRGDIDAITGFSFTSLLNLEARGVKAEDVVVLPYAAPRREAVRQRRSSRSPKMIKENPQAVKAFLSAFTKGAKEVMANPDASIDYVKARDGIINVDLEKRRLRMAIDAVVASPDARAEGFGVAVAGAAGADGLAGVGRVRDQDARRPGRRVERRAAAVEGRTQHAARRQEVGRAAMAFVDFRNVWLAYNDELLAQGQFAVEDISLTGAARASSSPSSARRAAASRRS